MMAANVCLLLLLFYFCIPNIENQKSSTDDYRFKPLRCQNGYNGQSNCLCFDTSEDAQPGPSDDLKVRVVNCFCWIENISTLQSFGNRNTRPITVRVSRCSGMQSSKRMGNTPPRGQAGNEQRPSPTPKSRTTVKEPLTEQRF